MFQCVDFRFDCLQCVIGFGVEGELVDNLARIDTFVNKMDGDAEDFDPVMVGVCDAMCARE